MDRTSFSTTEKVLLVLIFVVTVAGVIAFFVFHPGFEFQGEPLRTRLD